MEKADRKTMLVHFDTWLTLTATMSDAQVGILLRAAIAYARGESEACFGGDKVLALAFSMLKMSDDMDWKQYRLKCEKLKANIQKRWRKSNIQTNTNEYNSVQMGIDCVFCFWFTT